MKDKDAKQETANELIQLIKGLTANTERLTEQMDRLLLEMRLRAEERDLDAA